MPFLEKWWVQISITTSRWIKWRKEGHSCTALIVLLLTGQYQQQVTTFRALGQRILLYIYCKLTDLKDDPLSKELSEDDQFRNGCVGLCIQM